MGFTGGTVLGFQDVVCLTGGCSVRQRFRGGRILSEVKIYGPSTNIFNCDEWIEVYGRVVCRPRSITTHLT